MKRYTLDHKRRGCVFKDEIDRSKERGLRTPVHVERMRMPRVIACFEIRKYVGAAKAVDGLLGISDQEHGKIGAAIDPAEDAVLNRIGVLEFVDQRCRVALACTRGERRTVLPAQRAVEIEQ